MTFYDPYPDYVHQGCAMPSARAATPSGLSRFASSCKHHIAIAANVMFKLSITVTLLAWMGADLRRPTVMFSHELIAAADFVLFVYVTFLVWRRK